MSPQQRFFNSAKGSALYQREKNILHKNTDTIFQIFTLSTCLSLFELQDLRLSTCIGFEAGRSKCRKHENGLTSRLLPSLTGTTTNFTATTWPTWKVRERGWASMVWRRREPAHDWVATLVLPHLHHPTHHHAGVNIFLGKDIHICHYARAPMSLSFPVIALFLLCHTSHSSCGGAKFSRKIFTSAIMLWSSSPNTCISHSSSCKCAYFVITVYHHALLFSIVYSPISSPFHSLVLAIFIEIPLSTTSPPASNCSLLVL